MPGELFANNASTTLSASISSTGATTCTVTSATGFPAAATADGSQFRILIDSELMIVTNVSGSTFTITRGAEGTTAATHSNGATVTHVLTAGGLRRARPPRDIVNGATSILTVPGVVGGAGTTNAIVINTDYLMPFAVDDTTTIDQVSVEVTTLAASGHLRVAVYNADKAWQPTTLVSELGTPLDTSTTGVKTGSWSLTLAPGRYLSAVNADVAVTLRAVQGNAGMFTQSAIGTNTQVINLRASRTYAAFPSTGTAWTTASAGSATGLSYTTFFRVTDIGTV